MERKISTTKTYTDERSRELEQKYNNAVQTLTNDTQTIEAKCSAIDYTFKTRMESVEEHIQQLFAEGQQQCETMVDKNKKDTLQSVEAFRKDVIGQHQQLQQTFTNQHKRTETFTSDKFKAQQEHFDRVDASLLESKRNQESFQQTQQQEHAKHIANMDTLKKELRQQMHDMYTSMKKENDALHKQLQETKRELMSTLQDKHGELLNDVQQKQTEITQHVQQQQSQQSQKTHQQLQNIRNLVEGICTHMDSFTKEEQQHRKQHEEKLTQVVGVLEKTFAEIMTD